MLIGSFSLINASITFVVIAIGGAFIGLFITLVKYLFVKWVRSFGMENVTFHILIEILSPFVIYFTAELLHVSGILAVVVAGIAQSFEGKRLNPETANLNIASKSIWSVVSFTLNGLIFLLLGTQLPGITAVIWNSSSVNNFLAIDYIVIITAVLILIRFIWTFLIINEKVYSKENMGKFKASLIISMSGVRGTITLATAMSIPLLLLNGEAFPERNLVIFIASGVILLTLLIANFLLPLMIKEEHPKNNTEDETSARIEILDNVIKQLRHQLTTNNEISTNIVIRSYQRRRMALQNTKEHGLAPNISKEEKELRMLAINLESENIDRLIRENKIDSTVANHYIDALKKLSHRYADKKSKTHRIMEVFDMIFHFFNHRKTHNQEARLKLNTQILTVRESNYEYILDNFKKLEEAKYKDLIDKIISEYESSLELLKSGKPNTVSSSNIYRNVNELSQIAFQIERENIQAMFENGRISRESWSEMLKNISLLEIQISEYTV